MQYPKRGVQPLELFTSFIMSVNFRRHHMRSCQKIVHSYPQLMLLPDEIGFDDGVPRLIHVIRMVYEKINPDFAFFVNDHTFVIPEHLCKYLEHKNPTDYMYHGHALKNDGIVFNSGAAGYVLSRETMKKMVHLWDADDPLCTGSSASKWLQGNPALLTTECMKEKLGVVPVDTRHRQKWHRFHAFPLTRMVSGDVDQWYKNKHEVCGSRVSSFDVEEMISCF